MKFELVNFDPARFYSAGYYGFEGFHEFHIGFWKWQVTLSWEN